MGYHLEIKSKIDNTEMMKLIIEHFPIDSCPNIRSEESVGFRPDENGIMYLKVASAEDCFYTITEMKLLNDFLISNAHLYWEHPFPGDNSDWEHWGAEVVQKLLGSPGSQYPIWAYHNRGTMPSHGAVEVPAEISAKIKHLDYLTFGQDCPNRGKAFVGERFAIGYDPKLVRYSKEYRSIYRCPECNVPFNLLGEPMDIEVESATDVEVNI